MFLGEEFFFPSSFLVARTAPGSRDRRGKNLHFICLGLRAWDVRILVFAIGRCKLSEYPVNNCDIDASPRADISP